MSEKFDIKHSLYRLRLSRCDPREVERERSSSERGGEREGEGERDGKRKSAAKRLDSKTLSFNGVNKKKIKNSLLSFLHHPFFNSTMGGRVFFIVLLLESTRKKRKFIAGWLFIFFEK